LNKDTKEEVVKDISMFILEVADEGVAVFFFCLKEVEDVFLA
jgi:hypothetical protein